MAKKSRFPYFTVRAQVQLVVKCAAQVSGERVFTVLLQHEYCSTIDGGRRDIAWDAKQLCLDLGLELLYSQPLETEYVSAEYWHGSTDKKVVTYYDICNQFREKSAWLRDLAIAKAIKRGLLIPENNVEAQEYYGEKAVAA